MNTWSPKTNRWPRLHFICIFKRRFDTIERCRSANRFCTDKGNKSRRHLSDTKKEEEAVSFLSKMMLTVRALSQAGYHLPKQGTGRHKLRLRIQHTR